MIKKGTKCIVISDNAYNFKAGDIVISLEDSFVPYFVKEEIFKSKNGSYDENDYMWGEYDALTEKDVKVCDEEEEEKLCIQ